MRRDRVAGDFIAQRAARASMAAETLNFGGGVRNGRVWDDCGGLGLDQAARRAVAAKAAAAATVSSEVKALLYGVIMVLL